jgi:hypothetical protein
MLTLRIASNEEKHPAKVKAVQGKLSAAPAVPVEISATTQLQQEIAKKHHRGA